jgi:hypothetical protein
MVIFFRLDIADQDKRRPGVRGRSVALTLRAPSLNASGLDLALSFTSEEKARLFEGLFRRLPLERNRAHEEPIGAAIAINGLKE